MSRFNVLILILSTLFSSVVLANSVANVPLELYQSEIHLDNINRLNEKRVVFHSFHMIDKESAWIEGSNPNYDNSLASLLIVTPQKAYIIKDGFEPEDLVHKRKKEYWLVQQKWEKETSSYFSTLKA